MSTRRWLPVAVIAIVACDGARAPRPDASVQWTCPMHPQYVADKPGECPICGMKLVPVGKKATAPVGDKPLYYRNPMNPADTSPVPKKDPMGMDYVPVYPSATGASPGTVELDAQKRRLIGLKTAQVRRQEIAGELRTVGRVAMDETRLARVQPRFDGWIEKLEASYTGKHVDKGERLASVYSPELLATEQELLLAHRSRGPLGAAGLANAEEGPRSRLALLGISEAQIEDILRTGQPLRTLDVRAPISGYITVKNAIAGGKIDPAQPMFEIADLSTVWVLADVYEQDLPRVAVGERATVTLTYWPDRAWQGKVSYLYPILDEKTRTVKVRIAVANPKTELRPEMFATVVLEAPPRRALVVPEDAVIDSGTRKVVFVVGADGQLTPRPVETGLAVGAVIEIRGGLQEGEQVATGASFLLDSESHLQSALSTMTPASDGGAHGDAR